MVVSEVCDELKKSKQCVSNPVDFTLEQSLQFYMLTLPNIHIDSL